LRKHNISHHSEVKLNPHQSWRYDFYLPDYNTTIEYDGVQHFKFVPHFYKTQERLQERKEIDLKKTIFCVANGIYIIRISHLHFNRIEEHLDRALNQGIRRGYCVYFTGDEYKDQEESIFEVA